MQLPKEHLYHGRLLPVVRAVLSRPDATLLSWRHEPIDYASVGADSRGLFLLTGVASVAGQAVGWEVVLKIFRPLPDSSTSDPASPHYWRREALAYTSGLLDKLPEGVAIPRCFGLEEQEDGSLWLWLERAESDAKPPRPLSRFRRVAMQLGEFNGRYLTESRLADYPWLSRNMTRIWADENAYTIDLIAQTEPWETPALRRAFPHPVRQRLLTLWDKRETYFRALAALPQTLCHHDAGHSNLFIKKDREGVESLCLIDWELVGYGAIGEELGNLFGPALINFEVGPSHAAELASEILEGYLEGLHAAGWKGDPQHVRLGFAIAVLFRWIFAAAGWPVAIVTDHNGRAEQQTLEQWGRPMEEVYAQWAVLTYYLLDLAEQISPFMPA